MKQLLVKDRLHPVLKTVVIKTKIISKIENRKIYLKNLFNMFFISVFLKQLLIKAPIISYKENKKL